MRLQKYLAASGAASRRKAEEMIAAGRVTINGVSAALGESIKDGDEIRLDGKIIKSVANMVYYMLNKPKGYITTASDQFDRPCIQDLVTAAGIKERVFPVGRLDYDTSGLLILTNDGDLTQRLTHPKHNIEKKYQAKIIGAISSKEIETFAHGTIIDGYKTRPAKLSLSKNRGKYSWVNISISEGKNRQIRKMFEYINREVLELKRVAIGNLNLEELKEGALRPLTAKEIAYLKQL